MNSRSFRRKVGVSLHLKRWQHGSPAATSLVLTDMYMYVLQCIALYATFLLLSGIPTIPFY